MARPEFEFLTVLPNVDRVMHDVLQYRALRRVRRHALAVPPNLTYFAVHAVVYLAHFNSQH